jgi:transcriptional regulator with XRE-family HTH domain
MMASSDVLTTNYAAVIGRLVSAIRTETGLNQLDFADACRLKPGTLARIESGTNTATIDHVMLIGRALTRLDQLNEPAEIVVLVDLCRRQLKKRGIRVRSGKLDNNTLQLPMNHLDVVVGLVVMEWHRPDDEDDEDSDEEDFE